MDMRKFIYLIFLISNLSSAITLVNVNDKRSVTIRLYNKRNRCLFYLLIHPMGHRIVEDKRIKLIRVDGNRYQIKEDSVVVISSKVKRNEIREKITITKPHSNSLYTCYESEEAREKIEKPSSSRFPPIDTKF